MVLKRAGLSIFLILAPCFCRAADDGLALFASLRSTFETSCAKCHNAEKKKGALNMLTREDLLRGGATGPAIVPGDAKASLLYKMVNHDEEPFMPQKEAKLAPEVIAKIAAWINAGAPYDAPLKFSAPKEDPRSFWAFQPLKRVEPPAVKNAAWPKTPIDRFILAAQEAKGLSPSKPVSQEKLIRRVYFDMLGLPPSPDEIAAFVKDDSPDAYLRLTDRLLASPHFGERWARHWLDVARYADSSGYEGDSDRPNAYQYRDFVIRAFNDDLPFNTFVRWSLAGDEIAPENPQALAATGFCAAGPVVISNDGTPLEREKWRYDELDDMLSTTASSMLGLTVGCARCHDHKYDPIPTKEYYRMLAAFTTTKRSDIFIAPQSEIAEFQRNEAENQKRLAAAQTKLKEWLDPKKDAAQPSLRDGKIEALAISVEEKALLKQPVDKDNKAQRDLLKKHDKALQISDDDYRKTFSEDQRGTWDSLAAEIKAVEKTKPQEPPQGHVITDKQAQPEKSYLLQRGDPSSKTAEVELGFLSVLMTGEMTKIEKPATATTTYQRRAMADWLTNVDSGAGRLLARVIVNRVWQHHFGEGLVRTPNDFGFQGDRPSHPELLDWLASELIANGWHLKPLHKMILNSAVYLQDVAFDDAKSKIDPENRLLWRRRPLRLEAEILRDAVLSASGKLNTQLYGPSLKPAIPAEAMAGRNKDDKVARPKEDSPALWRRTVYFFTKRTQPTPLLDTFDTPSPNASCGRRNASTVATQALVLLNDPFIRNQSKLLAERLRAEGANDSPSAVKKAYALALGRLPTDSELSASLAFISRQPEKTAIENLCHVLFVLNEFMYVD